MDTPLLQDIDFEPEFNFLHVGQWGKGGFGEDRKNISNLVKYFIEAFKGRSDVGLVLKLNMSRNSEIDYTHTLKRLEQLKSNWKEEEVPPIYLIHGNLSDMEMSVLYNHPKIKAFVSFSHGEGFCLPLVEAAACGLPVIATNWSGHLDFLKKGKFSAVKYDMKEIPESAVWEDILIEGSRWAEVQEEDAKHRLKKMVSSYTKPKMWAKDLAEKIKEEFDTSVVGGHFIDTIKMSLTEEKSAANINPVDSLKRYVDTPDNYNVVYTMPMSAGDVFISTAVIDGLMKEIPEGAKLYFATQEKYGDILKNNPNVHKVIPWSEFMVNVEILEEVFDLALTPNTTTQFTFSNYVRRGQGRLLAEEFANHCICNLGEYYIEKESLDKELPHEYMTIHPGSGKGQWEARNYVEWLEIVQNIKSLYPELSIIQVGSEDEPLIDGVLDFRGKTNYQQLATVIEGSELHLTIDTFSMHLAAALNRPLVALFGSSYSQSSGPWVKDREKSKIILLEAEKRLGCSKACYKYQCKVNKSMPCINEIDPKSVLEGCAAILQRNFGNKHEKFENYEYKRIYGTISGYTTTYNCVEGKFPFEEAIKSALGFCNEVVVVDGESTDGTWEKLQELAENDDRIQLFQNAFDWAEPGIDGLQKSFARALCSNDFLVQFDSDEIFHEKDYEKWKMITKRFPTDADILHLPVIELWGDEKYCTGRRHSWKWRMSRNKPEITHGINKNARLTNEKTGKVYAKKGMSDGCEYVNAMTYESIPHTGFYNTQIEMARLHSPIQYANGMNEVFKVIPSVYHTSWMDIPRKLEHLKPGGVWDRMWSLLYQEEAQNRYPNIDFSKKEEVEKLIIELIKEGGEESDQVRYKFGLNMEPPKLLKEWIEKQNEGK
jgi:ADP-heptose:LPS heptosyltransferase/glycosyltransferase involved in cell wall biosynthesis